MIEGLYKNDRGSCLLEQNFFYNDRVDFFEDGWPTRMLLPGERDFIPGKYLDECKTRGCIMGWAYAAFGVRFSNGWWGAVGKEREFGEDEDDCPDPTQRRQEKLARHFAKDVLKEAGYSTRNLCDVEEIFDGTESREDGPFLKKVAHAWRVVAWRKGYDVKASEPGWKP